MAGRPEPGISPTAHARPASRRRPRGRTAVGLRLEVALTGSRPAVWRRLEVPSTLHLDEVHGLLQAVFGWTDSHLHRFTLGSSAFSREAEHFLCPYDVAEGDDDGVPAHEVRLDETLAEPGDQLRYTYDYGDEWVLVLTVEQVLAAPPTRATVTGGAGAPPPDDIGGIHAWNAAAPATRTVDLDPVAAALGEWERERLLRPDLRELRGQLWGTASLAVLDELVERADLGGPVEVDEEAAADLVRPYTWLLERVGGGLALTAAGWLPPEVVLAAMTELDLDREWIGKRNREDQTIPVASLRSTAQSMRLLRKSKGRLLRTKIGTALAADPEGLRRHVAGWLGELPADPYARAGAGLVLLRLAAGEPSDAGLAALLAAAGWQTGTGSAPTWVDTGHVDEVLSVLMRGHRMRRGAASPALRTTARLALRSRG